MKISVFWVYSLVDHYQHFSGICHLCLQSRRVSRTVKKWHRYRETEDQSYGPE
jgi:hypothetical protein